MTHTIDMSTSSSSGPYFSEVEAPKASPIGEKAKKLFKSAAQKLKQGGSAAKKLAGRVKASLAKHKKEIAYAMYITGIALFILGVVLGFCINPLVGGGVMMIGASLSYYVAYRKGHLL